MMPYPSANKIRDGEHCQRPPRTSAAQPNYAIVHLPEGTNVLHFYQLLLENGFPEVSFVNEVRENAFLPSLSANSAAGSQQKSTQISSNLANGANNLLMADSAATIANAIENARVLLRHQLPQQKPPTNLPKHYQNEFHRSSSPPSNSHSIHSRHRAAPLQTPIQVALHQMVTQSFKPQKQNAQHPQPQIITVSNTNSSSPASIGTADSPQMNQGGKEKGENVEMAGGNNQQQKQQNDELAICLLCNNRIMSTRLSNLTNHVRRHASMKQYRCCHCEYSHNEMAKVRLHMSHNHRDFDSQPIDQLTFEMQLQWGLLMEQCFPEHAKRFGPSAVNSQFRCLDQLQKCVDLDRSYACIECGELVPGYRLVNHLEETHKGECGASACAECGYESSSQWKVRLHISVKHAERAAEVAVEQRAHCQNPMIFLHKFFNEIQIPWLDEEEANLMAELRGKNAADQNEQSQQIQSTGENEVGGILEGEMHMEEEGDILDVGMEKMEGRKDGGIEGQQREEALGNEENGPKKEKNGMRKSAKLKEEPSEMATQIEGDEREMMAEGGMGSMGQQRLGGTEDGNINSAVVPEKKTSNSRKRDHNAMPATPEERDEGEAEDLTPKKRQSNRIMQMQQKQHQTRASIAGGNTTQRKK